MNKNKLTIKDCSLSFVVGFLLSQLSVTIVSLIGIAILSNNSQTDASLFFTTAIGYMICAISLYAAMTGVFLYFNKGKSNEITHKPNIKKLFLYIGIAIISFLSLYPIVTCVDSLLVKLNAPINTLSYDLTTKNYFISLISLVIAPAICEELLFRGIIFKSLKPYGKIISITISALMFCIFHMAISQTIYPILMGLLLAVIMYYENNIYYCIAIHMTNNFLSLTLSYFKINLIFNHWTYILLAIILVAAFLTIVIYFIVKKLKNTEKEKMTTNDKIFLLSSLGVMIVLWFTINFI